MSDFILRLNMDNAAFDADEVDGVPAKSALAASATGECTNMRYYDHPAYDDALRQAVTIARQYPIDAKAGARVWYDPKHDTMGVASRDDPNFTDKALETVAYAQKWNERTVEVRESGAGSTFVNP